MLACGLSVYTGSLVLTWAGGQLIGHPAMRKLVSPSGVHVSVKLVIRPIA